MYTFISILRGINVSGQKKIKMEDLKTLYQSLDLTNVKTYIQSGNVIFSCPESDASELAKIIEDKIVEVFNFSVAVLIRTRNNFEQIIQNNPFLTDNKEDFSGLYVTFLAKAPTQSALDSIKLISLESDRFYISGTEIYGFCPDGYGKTKLSNNFFEKKLGVAATTRNWKTVNKLYDLSAGS